MAQAQHEEFVQTLLDAFMDDNALVEGVLARGAKIRIEIGSERCMETDANYVEDRISNEPDFIEGGGTIGSKVYLIWKVIPKRSKSRVLPLPPNDRAKRPPYARR
jgi:hypothetical protein